MQLFAILFFAATIPLSAVLAERGRRVHDDRVHGRHRALRPGDGAASSRPARSASSSPCRSAWR